MDEINYKPKAYGGAEPYIFVSYSHKDSDDIFPIIGQMVVDGYRVWYDEGIEPSSNWNQFITDKITGCEYMICMISDKYALSHFCKKEIELGIEIGKKILPIYLDEKRMDEYIQLDLNRRQGIFMSSYSTSESFFEKLYQTSGIKACMEHINVNSDECEEQKRKLNEFKASPQYRLREILKAVNSGKASISDVKEKLDSIDYDIEDKADLIASFYKEIKEDISIIKENENEQKKRRENKESICESLESYISNMLLDAGVAKVERSNRITFRKSVETQIDDQILFVQWAEQNARRDLVKYTQPKPDTTAIKKAIKDGEEIDGVKLIEKKNIQIK